MVAGGDALAACSGLNLNVGRGYAKHFLQVVSLVDVSWHFSHLRICQIFAGNQEAMDGLLPGPISVVLFVF